MVNSEKQSSHCDREIDDGDLTSDSSPVSSDVSPNSASTSPSSSLSQMLSDIFVEDGDGDLLLQRSNREDNVLQFLQALDLQVMGACRTDERLKPLLKLNLSTGTAEELLLAHLSQHFEPAEIGLLARCLCIPLVSIRVGRINKQGTRLYPTDKRGILNLTLLPTSDLRISFHGDDGCTERLATLSCDSGSSMVEIEEISADSSGRSFLLKILEREMFYFWCSEKSKLLGDELLQKMKDLLERRPSLSDLTGISESRLDCFAIHLRAYLTGPSLSNAQAGPVLVKSTSVDDSLQSLGFNFPSIMTSLKSSRARHSGSQGLKSSSLYQASLSPRPSSFKDGTPRNLSASRCVARGKMKRRGDSYLPSADKLTCAPLSVAGVPRSNCSEKEKHPEAVGNCPFPLSSLESLGILADSSLLHPPTQVSSLNSSRLSPYYCWCPPTASSSPYARSVSQLPVSSTDTFILPSLSSLLSPAKSSSLLSSIPPLNVAAFSSLELPPLLPEPLVRAQMALPTSQQIPMFTPLMCDPIVHVPVIDVCSSGQGYLVSAGSAIPTTISPLHPNLVSPLMPEAESMVEKGARETLRLLLSSSSHQPNSLMEVLPSVIINSDEKQNLFVSGSRGLYTGSKDVNAIVSGIAAMGFAPLAEGSGVGSVPKRCVGRSDLVNLSEDSTSMNDGTSNIRDEGSDKL